MAIDIFNIEPHVVSRDLKGYTVLLYGAPKVGKTTIASKFPKALLLGFETGYLTIPGIMAAPVNSWSEFKKAIKQLKTDNAHAIYENIVVDTADIAYDLCEKYICSQEGVEKIGDIPYGAGWTKAKREFDEVLRAIPQMGYGLVMISHSQDKTFTDENGFEYNQIVPTLGNGPRLVVDRMSDLIIYACPIQEEDGTVHTVGYMRGTPRFIAGSRFKYTPDSIEFSYDNLVNAIGDAIDKQAAEFNGDFISDSVGDDRKIEVVSFDELMAEFNTIVKQIQSASGSEFKTKWAPRIVEITEKYLGKGKKVNDMPRSQVEQLDLIVSDLKDSVANGI